MVIGSSTTDEAAGLIRRVHDGDDAALGALCQMAAPFARRAAQHIVRDTHAADDLVQEAFFMVLKAVRSGRGPRDYFAGYVVLTVKRLAYRYKATQDRMINVDDPETFEQHLTDPPSTTQNDHIAIAWASLPPRWRTVLWLIEVDRYSPVELAAMMSMTPNAVSSLAARARKALRTTYLTLQRDDRESLSTSP